MSSCHGNLSDCEVVAICKNGGNDLTCRCRRGYYFKDNQCKECGRSCADGYYLESACSNTADVICRHCTACNGSQYEAASCTTTRDTICVDVTFPVGILQMNGSEAADDGTPIGATFSSNVFMERLVDMKELETPMYVTNNQQSMDFVWHRESGMDIIIRVSGVYLVPEYRELDAADDSHYYRQKKTEDKRTQDSFLKTQDLYCKHPVPDFYYLHLQVVGNRTSTAQILRCDSHDPTVPKCPNTYKDGDRFLKWNINSPCEKYIVTGERNITLTPLTTRLNEVVCSEESPLLQEVFGLLKPVTLEMMFPSTECSINRQQCNHCLASLTCDGGEPQSCCGMHCYSLGACQHAFSPACPTADVECASGDVHIFTLLPAFTSMDSNFKCHLAYLQPSYLYNVSYSILIPSLRFHISQQNYTATFSNSDEHHHRSDSFDFIQIWHDTRMPLAQDVILNGRHQELESTEGSHMQPFSIYSLKEHKDFSPKMKFAVSNKGNVEYTVPIQLDRPFAYSTTLWSKTGCDKNVSKIFPNQTIYKNDAMKVMARRIDVEGDYTYQMYHADKSPYIKLSVADGKPVLRTFMGKSSQGIIDGGKLSGKITWDMITQRWNITIAGAVKNCPGIFTLQVFSKMMSLCIGVYDLLIACPDQFNMTLTLPKREDRLPDIFVVFLNDSFASHRLVLSSIVPPVTLSSTSALQRDVVNQHKNEDILLWSPIFAVIVLTLLGLITIFGIYLYIKHRSASPAVDAAKSLPETQALNNQTNSMGPKTASNKLPNSSKNKLCITLFIVLYIVYSMVFTFSLTLALLYFTHFSLIANVSSVANYSANVQKELQAAFYKVESYEVKEETRLFRAMESRLQACSFHLQQQNRDFLHNYHLAVQTLLSRFYQKDGTLETLADQSLRQNNSVYMEQISQYLLDCNRTVHSILGRFQSHFINYVKDIARNGWFDFPREVFLAQEGDPITEKYMSPDQLERFLDWLQVDKSSELLSIDSSLAEKLSNLQLPTPKPLSDLSGFPADHIASKLPQEPMVADHIFLMLSNIISSPSKPAFTTDMTTAFSGTKSKRAFPYSKKGKTQVAEKKEKILKDSPVTEQENNINDEGMDGEDSKVVFYILIGLFLLMDVLLFIYRIFWMLAQVHAAREGYEDRIPTDLVSRKILAIQSGYRMSYVQEAYEPYSSSLENKENVLVPEERGSESEFNVYFCQTYPKSKDDILREIMAQKMYSTDGVAVPGASHEPAAPRKQKTFKRLPLVRQCVLFWYWLNRTLMSHLVWRFNVSAGLVALILILAYTSDKWLTFSNLHLLVGGQSAIRDLNLQVHMTNRHLQELAVHLSSLMHQHSMAVEMEISVSSTLLSSTLDTQQLLLSKLLEQMCQGVGSLNCVTSTISLPSLPPAPTWVSCNFLPIQVHLYQDSHMWQLENIVAQQLSPLLFAMKRAMLSLTALSIAMLCIMFLCHAGATVARYYMLIWGRLPRVPIYQISENTSLLYDGAPCHQQKMQRSASWLESCESGVYVGESEDTNTNRDV